MKKVLLILAAMVAMSGCFVSCSDDDEPKVLTEYNKALLPGVWDVTEAKGSPYEGELSFLVYDDELSIFEDGFEVEEYTYQILEGVLILTEKYDDEIAAKAEILKLNEKEAQLRITDLKYGYGSYTVKLKKRKDVDTPTKYL